MALIPTEPPVSPSPLAVPAASWQAFRQVRLRVTPVAADYKPLVWAFPGTPGRSLDM